MLKIRSSSFAELARINQDMPEFGQAYDESGISERLQARDYLGLIAEDNGKFCGFKLGYGLDKFIFYSWLGGVLPGYRRHGIAASLLIEQEGWVRQRGYTQIQVKTRNCHNAMLQFLLKHDYLIYDIEAKTDIQQNRILLTKEILHA